MSSQFIYKNDIKECRNGAGIRREELPLIEEMTEELKEKISYKSQKHLDISNMLDKRKDLKDYRNEVELEKKNYMT